MAGGAYNPYPLIIPLVMASLSNQTANFSIFNACTRPSIEIFIESCKNCKKIFDHFKKKL